MNIEKGSVKSLIFSVVSTDIFGLLFFPLFDWIFDSLNNNKFEYSIKGHIILPLVLCTVISVICWFVERNKAKKEKKK